MAAPRHVPVLLERVLELLGPALEGKPAVVVDATLGLGGHAEALLTRFPAVRLIGLDRDPQALSLSGERLRPYGERVTLVHAVYDEIAEVLEEQGLGAVDGILFDLGVSSLQLDLAERGFAYSHDAPLDMRMDPTTGRTAGDVVNGYTGKELARVLREYGEERFASRIADAIVRERAKAPFTSSAALVEIVRAAIPAATRRTGGNPAKRTFQALRIEVNAELTVLARAVPAALDSLAVGGRIVVLAYQSLEDRIVKRAFTAATASTVPHDLPFIPAGSEPALRLLVRGSEEASAAEIGTNPRAASVRLRAVERVREAA